MDRATQKKITSDHLKNGMETEVWLIPFGVTMALMGLALIVMIAMYLVKNRRSFTGTSSDDCRQKYKYATAESDETMTRLTTKDLDCVVEVNSPSSSSNHRECDGRLVVESRRVETQAHEQSPPPYGWSINSNSNVPDQRQQGNTTEHGFPTSWDNMPSSSL